MARRRRGISLLEVVVVIGVIGLLVAVLLPALANVRSAARTTRDLSNQRQLAAALLGFAGETGYLPTVSNAHAARRLEESRGLEVNPATGDLPPWYDQIARHLGGEPGSLLQCPADAGLDDGGYLLPSGPIDRRVPVSYGLNADLTALNVPLGGLESGQKRTALGLPGDFVGVYAAADLYAGEQYHGLGAGGRLSRVAGPTSTLLLADCGVRRPVPTSIDFLDRPDVLAYTTNYAAYNDADPNAWGRLSGLLQTPWLATRVPLARHDPAALNPSGNLALWEPADARAPPDGRGGRLPIAFVDGRAELVPRGGFGRVKVTPFAFRPTPATD